MKKWTTRFKKTKKGEKNSGYNMMMSTSIHTVHVLYGTGTVTRTDMIKPGELDIYEYGYDYNAK